MRIPVIILAGSRDGEHDPLAQFGKVSHKAVLPVGGIPMIERVLHALEEVEGLGPFWICIEKPDCLAFLGKRVRFFPAAASPSETVAQALAQIGTPCLVTTADHALLQSSWIKEFLKKSYHSGADLTAGIATSETIERDVPETKRTYIRLSDQTFSGCNLFWFGHKRALSVLQVWQRLQHNRKRPLRMAFILGIGTLFCALVRCLSTRALEKRIQYITGATVALIPLSNGHAAIDVDKISDVHLVEALLSLE